MAPALQGTRWPWGPLSGLQVPGLKVGLVAVSASEGSCGA